MNMAAPHRATPLLTAGATLLLLGCLALPSSADSEYHAFPS